MSAKPTGPPALAARLFLGRLEVLAEEAARRDGFAVLSSGGSPSAMAKITALATVFSRLPACRRVRCSQPVTGSTLLDTLVSVEAPDVSGGFEGVVVDGAREGGTWTNANGSKPTSHGASRALLRFSGREPTRCEGTCNGSGRLEASEF